MLSGRHSKAMKVAPGCRGCLEQLVRQVAELATADTNVRTRATEAGLAVLECTFSYDKLAPQIATECARVIKGITGNSDPYRQMKAREMQMAERLFKDIRSHYGDGLRSCVKLASVGNTIDFFKDPAAVMEEMRRPPGFAIDHVRELEDKLKRARRLLYLADNAGECFFDLPLLKKLRQRTRVVYVVRGYPVQNDVTLEELRQARLIEEVGEVITTGSDAVGIDLSSASEEFRRHFKSADLVFAKGMANYETLSELPADDKLVYCLMAKCQPIADSLKVPLNSYVVMLQ